jgi:hypothetical protein
MLNHNTIAITQQSLFLIARQGTKPQEGLPLPRIGLYKVTTGQDVKTYSTEDDPHDQQGRPHSYHYLKDMTTTLML